MIFGEKPKKITVRTLVDLADSISLQPLIHTPIPRKRSEVDHIEINDPPSNPNTIVVNSGYDIVTEDVNVPVEVIADQTPNNVQFKRLNFDSPGNIKWL